MDIAKIKVDKIVSYKTGAGNNSGRGKVTNIRETPRGPWITVHDKQRGKDVTVRAAQISA